MGPERVLCSVLFQKYFIPEDGEVKINSNQIGYVGVTPLIINGTLRKIFIWK